MRANPEQWTAYRARQNEHQRKWYASEKGRFIISKKRLFKRFLRGSKKLQGREGVTLAIPHESGDVEYVRTPINDKDNLASSVKLFKRVYLRERRKKRDH